MNILKIFRNISLSIFLTAIIFAALPKNLFAEPEGSCYWCSRLNCAKEVQGYGYKECWSGLQGGKMTCILYGDECS